MPETYGPPTAALFTIPKALIMAYTQCILKIPGGSDISLPKNGTALLSALDKSLEEGTYQTLDADDFRFLKENPIPGGDFTTFIRFELDIEDSTDIIAKITEVISYACAPEIIEASHNYQLISIDHCAYSFK